MIDYSVKVLSKIKSRIASHMMLTDKDCVGVAVSGGADSVALLHALHELYSGQISAVIHLNHCLRGADSDCDEEFVRALANSLDYPVHVRRQDVARINDLRQGNLEQSGRICRYQYFRELVDEGVCSKVVTAHTRSDQAETVLFRLLRGAGGAGLSGIRSMSEDWIIRPMLAVSRSEVMDYLKNRNIAWREDSSNQDLSFTRNRLRSEVLPLLKRDFNPNIEAVLANTADWAVEEDEFWCDKIACLSERCVRPVPQGIELDVKEMRFLHPAEQRRLLHSILNQTDQVSGASGFNHIEEVRNLLHSSGGSGAVDLPGLRVERSFDLLLLSSPKDRDRKDYELELPVPGSLQVPGVEPYVLRTTLWDNNVQKSHQITDRRSFLDWDLVPKPLKLRNWRPGDSYCPEGQNTMKKIKDLFQQHRISSWRRNSWPVVSTTLQNRDQDCIVWVRGFGPEADFAVREGCRHVLIMDELQGTNELDVSKNTPFTS